MNKLPIVALIGQTNAGKSSLLNRMAHKNIAIVAREEGTTRDNVVATIDNQFILIDTAGLKDPSDDFEASIQEQIQDAIESGDIILVTLDSSKYFDHKDAKIAKDALRSKKPVFLVLNKADLGDSLPIEEFRALGISPENTIYTSATTGQGIRELKSKVFETCFSESINRFEFSTRIFLTDPTGSSRRDGSAGVPVYDVLENSSPAFERIGSVAFPFCRKKAILLRQFKRRCLAASKLSNVKLRVP